MTHNLRKDLDGNLWHHGISDKEQERLRIVDKEWVRLHFGERVHIILQEQGKVTLTIH